MPSSLQPVPPSQHHFQIIVVILPTLGRLIGNGVGGGQEGLDGLCRQPSRRVVVQMQGNFGYLRVILEVLRQSSGRSAFLHVLLRLVNTHQGEAVFPTPIPAGKQLQCAIGQKVDGAFKQVQLGGFLLEIMLIRTWAIITGIMLPSHFLCITYPNVYSNKNTLTMLTIISIAEAVPLIQNELMQTQQPELDFLLKIQVFQSTF